MKRIFLMLTAIVLLAACSKKNKDDDPQGPGNGAATLYTKVLGRWSFSGVSIDAPRSTGRTMDNADSFIEFLDDSTYYIYDSDGGMFTGTFSAKDSTTIALGDFGTLSSMTFTQGTVNFILTYDGKEIRIVANKAPAIALTDDTKLLCRNWYLTSEFDGHYMYNAARILFDANGEPVGSFVPDSITFQITPSGTYLAQMFKNKKLRSVDVFNWKWHSSLPRYFVYWDNGYEPDEVRDKTEILILSKDELKFQQAYDYNNDGRITEEETSTCRFTALNK